MRRSFFSVLLGVVILLLSAAPSAPAQLNISITIAPPALPVYDQPLCPEEGYIWTPGYWAYDPDDGDYFWVPGTWVPAPEPGLLWTPPYWGWGGASFVFYEGYWGPHVGFYGGIAYGFGYFGVGYEGGRWENGHFFYNRTVNNINVTNIHNVYNTTIVNNTTINRVSYNGGQGGITRSPTPEEEAAAHERHVPPVAEQTQHRQAAQENPEMRASRNQGKPPIAATPKPGAFNDKGVVRAREAGAPYHPPAAGARMPTRGNGGTAGATAIHPKELPPSQHPAAPNTGNPNLDKKYQQQQEKLIARQEQERQKLQAKQDKDHQKLRGANEPKKQQLEQVHQKQTQQLQQRHAAQLQSLQRRQAVAKPRR